MSDLTPQSVNHRGQITATDEDGNRHLFHTDPVESRQFADAVRCFVCGREELSLLLHSNDTPQRRRQRIADGRSDEQLKEDWLAKVSAAGMPKPAALAFLTARLATTN